MKKIGLFLFFRGEIFIFVHLNYRETKKEGVFKLKSNAERMYLLFLRSTEIKHRKEEKKLNFCKASTVVLSFLLICCAAAMPTSYKSAAVSEEYGTIMLIDGMGGYVLTAVVTFIVATAITVICIKIKNRRNRK